MNTTSSLTRATILIVIWGEFVTIIAEARWLFLLILLLVIADFRFGRGESRKRYCNAKEKGDTVTSNLYAWHKSRATRRTVNKLVDYIIWVSIGIAVGQALLLPIGLSRLLGGVAATALIAFCEISSIVGHFLYLHSTEGATRNFKTFARAFFVAYLKKRTKM